MRFLILIVVFAGRLQSATGQAKHFKAPKLMGDLNCTYMPKYSAKQRSKFYPFDIADTIKLVSFRYNRLNYFPMKGDTLLLDSLLENKSLSRIEVDQLTDIFYNNFYKKQPNYGMLTQCFLPRNAILFFDKAGHLKEYIIICFHCDRHKESSNKIDWGDECTQKMEKLRQFFVSVGLKFGTDKTVGLYPGEAYE
jgi:hypothetical protein